MTVRELVRELTKSYVNWDNEVQIYVTENSVKSGRRTKWKNYKVDKCNLHSQTWYVGDRCHIVLKK